MGEDNGMIHGSADRLVYIAAISLISVRIGSMKSIMC